MERREKSGWAFVDRRREWVGVRCMEVSQFLVMDEAEA